MTAFQKACFVTVTTSLIVLVVASVTLAMH
jgi:hypothetical protein